MATEVNSLARRAAIHAALAQPARLAIVDALAVQDASPGELGGSVHLPSNLLAHHLRVLEEAGVITRSRSEADRRRAYVRLVPAALAMLVPAPSPSASRVVFVCTRNSARSQLAAALWAGHSRVPAVSAGTHPSARIHRRAISTARRHGLALDHRHTAAVEAMREIGIDISEEFPKLWTDEVVRAADVVVTMGCGDACPVFPGKRYEDWTLDDPDGQDMAAVRLIRDQIEQRVRRLLDEVGVAAHAQ